MILVVDTSRSMQAKDVTPTRLGAAQQAISTFLDHAPKGLRVGLVVFAGEAQVATPPTQDHKLVETSVDQIDQFLVFGGTAIGDALQTAVELGKQVTGPEGSGPGHRSARRRRPTGRWPRRRRRLRRASARTRAPSRSSSSPTARRREACCSRSRAPRSRSAPASRSTRSRSGRPRGSSTARPFGGFAGLAGHGSAHPGASRPGHAPRNREDDGRRVHRGAHGRHARDARTRTSARGWAASPGTSEITWLFVALAAGLLLVAGAFASRRLSATAVARQTIVTWNGTVGCARPADVLHADPEAVRARASRSSP